MSAHTAGAPLLELTTKQAAFADACLAIGNASEAYRQAYNAEKMAPATVHREAAQLLQHPKIAAYLAQRRAEAATAAGLSRAWVLHRLMQNARVCLGEEKVRLAVKDKDAGGKPIAVEIEVSARDPSAANRALELLGKSDEVRLFVDRQEHTGKDGAPLSDELMPNPREMARAILSVLRDAHSEAAQQPDEEPDDADEDPGDDAADADYLDGPPEPLQNESVVAVAAPAVRSGSPACQNVRPATLAAGEREVLDNGAEIRFASELGKFSVHDGAGMLHGFRRSLDEARTFASTLKAPEVKA